MKAFVLVYHSHHVVGEDYARNDHMALAIDLERITDLGCEIVPLRVLVDRFFDSRETRLDGRRVQVALTFADGPIHHVHPALPRVAHSRQARADFTQVLTDSDAEAQIADAGTFIAAHTRSRNAPFFAYPFGQSNSFLAQDYLPRNAARLRLRAAFTDG